MSIGPFICAGRGLGYPKERGDGGHHGSLYEGQTGEYFTLRRANCLRRGRLDLINFMLHSVSGDLTYSHMIHEYHVLYPEQSGS